MRSVFSIDNRDRALFRYITTGKCEVCMHIMIMIGVVMLVFFTSCTSSRGNVVDNEEKSIMVFSAASLTDVLIEAIDSFEVEYHVKVKANMASSGTLARQIEQGATPDVYISASKKWADYVDTLGFINEGSKVTISKNELVLIAPQSSEIDIAIIDSSLDFKSLLGTGRLSIGDPAHVPAGKYARQALEYYGWYNDIDNILPAKDVRSALMVVEMGEAPLGIVYRTDAEKSDKVKVLGTFPEQSHKPIVYVAGVCSDNDIAKSFMEYLNSAEVDIVWGKYGFK